MTPADLETLGERLLALVETVVEDLRSQEETSVEIESFVAEMLEGCTRLEAEIEATTVAKAGLEGMLTAYASRYGEAADSMPDVIRFRAILAEKVRQLDALRETMAERAQRIETALSELSAAANRTEDSLAELEQALFAAKASREAVRDKLLDDMDKIHALVDRFWPVQDGGQDSPRINLSRETLHSVVNQVVDSLEADQEERHDLLSQVLASIKDDDIRRVLTEKLEPDASV